MNYSKIIDLYNDKSIHKSIPLMEFVRELTSDVSSIRKANRIPESYPLISLDLYIGDRLFPLVNDLWYSGPSDQHFSTPYRDLIREACNVDEVVFDFSSSWVMKSYGLSEDVTINFRKAGPVFGSYMGRISTAVKSGSYVKKDSCIVVDDIEISDEFYSSKISEGEDIGTKVLHKDSFIHLDTRLGFGKSLYSANVLSREINNERKSLGTKPSDIIDVVVFDSNSNLELLKLHIDSIKSNCKINSLELRESSFGRSIAIGSSKTLDVARG